MKVCDIYTIKQFVHMFVYLCVCSITSPSVSLMLGRYIVDVFGTHCGCFCVEINLKFSEGGDRYAF